MALFLRKPLKNVTPPKEIYRCGSGDTVMGAGREYKTVMKRLKRGVGSEIFYVTPASDVPPPPYMVPCPFSLAAPEDLRLAILSGKPVLEGATITLPMKWYVMVLYNGGEPRYASMRSSRCPFRFGQEDLEAIMHGRIFAVGESEVREVLQRRSDLEEIYLRLKRRFVSKPLPTDAELEEYLRQGRLNAERVGKIYEEQRRRIDWDMLID